jgi:hypothetical protein
MLCGPERVKATWRIIRNVVSFGTQGNAEKAAIQQHFRWRDDGQVRLPGIKDSLNLLCLDIKLCLGLNASGFTAPREWIC